jgi:hypothetical protein
MLLFTAALGAQTTAAPGATQTPEWKTYSYPAQGFSASFPSKPTLQKRDVPTDYALAADTGCFMRSYLVKSGPAAFFVGICDYSSVAAGKDTDTLLQMAKNKAPTSSNSQLVREKKIALGIYRGVEFEAENYAAHLSARVYMVGTTLYQTQVVSPLGKPYADTARFLDSFQLIARVQE